MVTLALTPAITRNNDSNSYDAIHLRAMNAAANYKRCEIELLEAIFQVEARQVYFQMEIKNLHQYCVEMLDLSLHAAYNFIDVMRKSAEVPAMLEAVRNGHVTVSKARKICSVINVKNAKEWLELARYRSSRIVEKAVAMANPRAAVPESMKYVSGDVLELKFAVSEEWSELLNDIKDLMSQKSKRAVSTEEALFQLMSDYKRKHDPVEKASRAEVRANSKLAAGSKVDLQTQTPRSRYIPATVRHELARRDDAKCSFVDRHGKRCGSKRWVQIHHKQHFADGGSHSSENLETLCWPHHVMKHRH